jgi:hypothetical protein
MRARSTASRSRITRDCLNRSNSSLSTYDQERLLSPFLHTVYDQNFASNAALLSSACGGSKYWESRAIVIYMLKGQRGQDKTSGLNLLQKLPLSQSHRNGEAECQSYGPIAECILVPGKNEYCFPTDLRFKGVKTQSLQAVGGSPQYGGFTQLGKAAYLA